MSFRPQHRGSPFSAVGGRLDLQKAWIRSQAVIERLQRTLLSTPLPQTPACVAISGSLSRMEYHAASDLDLLIVLDDRAAAVSDKAADELFSEAWRRIGAEGLGATRPKPDGVFAQCVSWKALTNPAVRGVVNEDVTTYGHRMQLLMDAQPVLNDHVFEELQTELLNWYVETRVSQLFKEAGPFGWLRQDVQRYWRSIWSRAYWLHEQNPEKSLKVNVKLRSSRAVIVAAFLYAVDVAQRTGGDTPEVVATLQKQLNRTPLERLTSELSPVETSKLVANYQAVWHFVSNRDRTDNKLTPEIRCALTRLAECLPSTVTDLTTEIRH